MAASAKKDDLSYSDIFPASSPHVYFDPNGAFREEGEGIIGICGRENDLPVSYTLESIRERFSYKERDLPVLIRLALGSMFIYHLDSPPEEFSPNAWAVAIYAVAKYLPEQERIVQQVREKVEQALPTMAKKPRALAERALAELAS